MEVPKSDLLSALDAISFGLGRPGFLEGSEHITFDGEHVWAYDGEVGGLVPCPEPLQELHGSVDGRKLHHFVTRAPGEVLHLRLSKKKKLGLEIRSEHATISLLWNEGPPSLPYSIPEQWGRVPKGFSNALALTALCCATHLTRPLLTCVRIRTDRIQATDAMRAIEYTLARPLPKDLDVLVPKRVALLVAGLESTLQRIAVEDERAAWFKTKDGTQIFCPVMSGDYPDLSEHLDSGDTKAMKFSLPLPDLNPVLDRARIFCGEDAVEGESYVTMSVRKQRLYIDAEDASSHYQEWIKLEKKTPELSITLNTQHLLDLVEQEQETECELSENKMRISAENWKYISVLREEVDSTTT